MQEKIIQTNQDTPLPNQNPSEDNRRSAYQTPLPIMEQPPKMNGWKVVAFILLFLLLGMGGALAYFWQKGNSKQLVVSQPTPSPVLQAGLPSPLLASSVPTISPLPDETAGWKTYKNTNFGFSLSYPPKGEGPTGTTISCGNAILEEQTGLGWQISFENYFAIYAINGYSTVQEYLTKNNINVHLSPISIKGADEAFQIINNDSPTSLINIMRQGSSIIRIDKNNGVLDGCFKPKDWDLSKYFSFQ